MRFQSTLFSLAILLSLCLGCSTSIAFAQEAIFPLKGNPVLESSPAVIQALEEAEGSGEKGFKRNFPKLCATPTAFAVSSMTPPTCKEADGGFSMQINGAIPPYDVYQDGDLIYSATTDETFDFDNLLAGAYFMMLIDAEGTIYETGVELDNAETEAIPRDNWFVEPVFCSENGRISKAFLGPLLRQYRVYDQAGDQQGEFEAGVVNELFLAAGTYYLRAQDAETACRAYYIFEIKEEITLNFPLIEDFSTADHYPDPLIWSDDLALINDNYAWNAPTVGVATLDGLNQYGLPYEAAESTAGTILIDGEADRLTSRPFCAGEIDIFETSFLYLKFQYQPQGYGDYPNPGDSLFVEVKGPSGQWFSIFGVDGYTSDQAETPFIDTTLTIVTDTLAFDGLQFRFRNKATISGSNDHWNIDYVILDDEVGNYPNVQDVGFSKNAPDMLKRYTQMPWSQFYNDVDTEVADAADVPIQVRNNFDVTTNRSLSHKITEVCSGDIVYSYDAGIADVLGAIDGEVSTSVVFIDNDVKTALNDFIIDNALDQKDSVIFENQWVLSVEGAGSDLNANNDTVYQYQTFFNSFAYDDGTAEKAYGLYGIGAEMAYQYIVNQDDHLNALQICFVNQNSNVSGNEFSLKVWKNISAGTNEGELIYEQSDNTPNYLGQVNGFWTYAFDTPLAVNAGDTLYIGVTQEANDWLNFGFDSNENSTEYFYINYAGNWEESIFPGSVMMRPVFGNSLPDDVNVGIEEHFTYGEDIVLYPNPATDQLYIRALDTSGNSSNLSNDTTAWFYDALGRLAYSTPLDQTVLDISDLAAGLYIVRLTQNGQNKGQAKFVKE